MHGPFSNLGLMMEDSSPAIAFEMAMHRFVFFVDQLMGGPNSFSSASITSQFLVLAVLDLLWWRLKKMPR